MLKPQRCSRALLCVLLFLYSAELSMCLAKEAGIFYSTLYAKTMEPELLNDFGGDATAWFLEDVNGDGMDDAVAYYADGAKKGQWYVALSDGCKFSSPGLYLTVSDVQSDSTVLMGDVNGDGRSDVCHYDILSGNWYVGIATAGSFSAPVCFATTPKKGFDIQFLSDINGDGRADAVAAWTGKDQGQWLAGLSTGKTFSDFKPVLRGFAKGADQCFLADVNGDAKADAIAYYKQQGLWSVALADEQRFQCGSVWKRDFGKDKDFGFVCDVDDDGKADIGYHERSNWQVSYSDGKQFTSDSHHWIAKVGDGIPKKDRNKQNPPPINAYLTGSISKNSGWACIVDGFGRWFAVNNPQKNKTLNLSGQNTYFAWRCSYIPQIPGHEGTYDSGDAAVNDAQIKMIHDAGFTYVMFDITNGYHNWVDSRAQAFIDRVHHFNDNLAPGQHKMYVTIALGRTRQISDYDAYFAKLELEAKRCWDDWYGKHSDIWYHLNGKPLLIHMQDKPNGNLYTQLPDFTGNRLHIDKFSNRWMCIPQANSYGWIVPKDNPHHPEMMAAMPGFYNGGTFIDRQDGDYYRNHWRRIIQYQPDSVFVESLNESWEHNSVEPAYMFNTREPHKGIKMWTDAYGDRMDDFYWVMTKQYMKLYMDGALYENTYLQEYTSEGKYGPIYKATKNGFVPQGNKPHQAPILLMPADFIKSFKGQIE